MAAAKIWIVSEKDLYSCTEKDEICNHPIKIDDFFKPDFKRTIYEDKIPPPATPTPEIFFCVRPC